MVNALNLIELMGIMKLIELAEELNVSAEASNSLFRILILNW
jgi:hypothetical protein